MIEHPSDETLMSYLDADLEDELAWRVDIHLAACAACAERVVEWKRLIDDVGRLPSDVQPEHDLWADVAERIAPVRVMGRRDRRAAAGSTARYVAWLPAIAATLLVGMGLSRFLFDRLESAGAPSVAAVSGATFVAAGESSTYDAAIHDLLIVLGESREALAPETVISIENNLRVIDEAIVDTRSALETDPANARLHSTLGEYMQSKMTVLQMVSRAVE